MNIEIKELLGYTVAYTRTIGAYNKRNYETGFNKLADWAERKIITIYCDDPESTPPAQCRLDTYITIPENTRLEDNSKIQIQNFPRWKYAVCNCELTATEFAPAWQEAFSWLSKNDFNCYKRPHFEAYHNDQKIIQRIRLLLISAFLLNNP